MGPTAEQRDAFHPFELFVGIITVALRKPDIIAEEFTGNLPTTAATVIMEHDVSGDTVPQAPLITFSRLVLFVVYNRYHTLVYLYIFTREYLLLKEIIEKLQLFLRCPQKKLTSGLCGSVWLSECWWCMRWIATQRPGESWREQMPSTEKVCS